MKKELEDYKMLKKMFEEKAKKIALLKNKYDGYKNIPIDYIEYGYNDDKWEVIFARDYKCGENYNSVFYITEEEMLTDLDILKERYEKENEERTKKQLREKKEKEEKERIKKEKAELALYERLRKKYNSNNLNFDEYYKEC